jgi:hypothetical protein
MFGIGPRHIGNHAFRILAKMTNVGPSPSSPEFQIVVGLSYLGGAIGGTMGLMKSDLHKDPLLTVVTTTTTKAGMGFAIGGAIIPASIPLMWGIGVWGVCKVINIDMTKLF